jgi:uncharacterized membrane protein YidH (DUF202 family)
MPQSPGIYDPGAQLERTALAWSRVSVAIVANGALLVRAGLVHNLGLLTAGGLVAASIGVVLWLLSAAHYSALVGWRAGHLLAESPRAVVALATFVAFLSVIALLAILNIAVGR